MFNLMRYDQTIRNYAASHDITPLEGLTHFMLNLAVMRPHYEGFPEAEINFRQLGQEWNKLPSDTRLQQKHEMQVRLQRSRSRSD